ncbi:hypothetical protein [Burkholderia vietnamiensis]|uniref:hypothetical protein n=1 Tax=Burkholderia vietnamiensis TaxID=60552 RepID=UPI001CF4DEBC|nr:hypothetical protein [Burkholderia vietnamiensis]MCA8448996.1 hypothetical protein [Burkholderia vietnamiensis]
MAHITDTTASSAQAKPRRSPRSKASNEQVSSNTNPTSKEDTTMTTTNAAAEANFADVADATSGTPGTSAPEAQPAAALKATPTDAYVKIRVFVLAMTRDGNPEFFTAIVGTTAEEIAAKKHHGKAARKAANEGYKWPMSVFDERSTAARQLEVMAGRQRDAMNRS